MGKKYCDVGRKWCKLLQHGVCKVAKSDIITVTKCPRIAAIETITLHQLIREVNFEDVFARVCHYFPSQTKSKKGYENAFNELLKKRLYKSHNLNDLFISVEIADYNGEPYLNTYGKKFNSDVRYGIEFCKWSEWVSMYITKETLESLTKEDIVAGCLYEMTFDGFTEKTVMEAKNKLFASVEELKKDIKESTKA